MTYQEIYEGITKESRRCKDYLAMAKSLSEDFREDRMRLMIRVMAEAYDRIAALKAKAQELYPEQVKAMIDLHNTRNENRYTEDRPSVS